MTATFNVQIRHQFSSGFALDVQLCTTAQRVGIVGPSGSGKTTLLHAMAGIFRPDLAQIHVSGRPFATKDEWASPRARRVGLVTQDALLYPHLSVSENLVFSVHSPTTIDTEDPIVEMLEIAPLLKRRVRNLSGGERQRVALGRALLAQPKLLLLDEPFCAVDQARRMRIIRELDAHLKSTATPAVLVSHDEVVIEAICSQKLTIEQGTMSHNE